MRITCGHCSETFVIGEDAFLVTDEDKYRTLSEADAKVIIMGTNTRKPDMVMHWTRPTSEKERIDEQRKAAEIKNAINQGESRSWWCGKCYNRTPNAYPKEV